MTRARYSMRYLRIVRFKPRRRSVTNMRSAMYTCESEQMRPKHLANLVWR